VTKLQWIYIAIGLLVVLSMIVPLVFQAR